MHKILKLVKREYLASVKTKGFIIGLILAPIFMGGSLIAFALLKDRVDVTDKKAAIIDRSGMVAQVLVDAAENRRKAEVYKEETGNKVKPDYIFEIVKPDEENIEAQRLELSDRVRSRELHAFIEIGSGVVHPRENGENARIAYHARNPAMDDLRGWIVWPINDYLRKLRLTDASIDESEVGDLFDWMNVDGMGLVSVDEETGNVKQAERSNEVQAIVIPIILMMLMFLMIMMAVPGLLQSVMEEKTQRIAEVLLGSIKPFEFMMGKVLSGVAIALTSSVVYFIGGILVVRHIGYEKYIPYHILPWFFVYMLMAIIMFGSISAALGSTCSEAKDAQSLTFPMILPMLIPMFVYFPVVKEPLGSLATWVSLFPPFTPTLMLLRQTTPAGIPFWQPCVGVLGVLLSAIFFVWAGGRIFRVAILMQGTPPKMSNIIRWAIRG